MILDLQKAGQAIIDAGTTWDAAEGLRRVGIENADQVVREARALFGSGTNPITMALIEGLLVGIEVGLDQARQEA